MNLSIKKFDIKNIKPTNSCHVIGYKNCGKTVLLKDIIFNQNITDGMVISDNKFSNFKYPTNKYSHELLDNLLDSQKKKMSENLLNSNMVVIYEPLLNIDIKMKELVINNRHYQLMLLIDSQLLLDPVVRANIDFVFIFKSSNSRLLYEKYFSFTTYEIFEQIFNELGSHECLVIDNSSNSNKIEDKVFWYKAKLTQDQILDTDPIR